jgi:hypothetical protein
MPSTATDRLDGLSTSVAVKAPCVAVTSTNITLAGLQTYSDGDRVLVNGQTDQTTNGIYDVSSGNWSRAKDFDGNRDAVQGTLVLVGNNLNDGVFWQLTTPDSVVIGTSQITFDLRDDSSYVYPLIQLEANAGITIVNTSYPPYNRARYASWADWKLACDTADEEGTVNGDWTLTANIELPIKSRFTGGSLLGNFEVLYQQRLHGWMYGINCYNLRLSGINFCTVENLIARNNVYIDGYNGTTGTFWNNFNNWNIDKMLEISISNFAVNLNSWRGGRIGYLYITGNQVTYPASQAHANAFYSVDFTDYGNVPSGVLQDDTAFEVNFLYGCYYEGGGNINGNFHVFGLQGDAQGYPSIARYAHIMGMVGRNSRLSRDFLSTSPINAAKGGNWDILDANGKPPSLSQSGGASVSVTSDSTEPCGIARAYQATFADAFDSFSITIQPTGSAFFGLVLFYKSAADFVNIESNDGTGAIAHSPTPVVVGTPWKMLRISGPANVTSTTGVTLYAYGGTGGAAKVMAIGGFFAGGERAVPAPSRPDRIYRYGSATYDPPSLADGAGVTTTVAVAGADPGSFAQASFSQDLQGITLTAWVSAAGTVSVRLQNESGGVLDISSGTLRVQVQEAFA